MKKRVLLRASVVALFAAFSAMAQGSAVLLGAGTLQTPDDLTVISTGSGNLEFLDLSVTDAMSVPDAIAAYSGFGFRWANEAEVAVLYNAFGIVYASESGRLINLDASLTSRTNYVNYLGDTTGLTTSLGWIADNRGSRDTYSCISITGCNPLAFTFKDSGFFTDPNFSIGVFLVRDADGSVPAPGTLSLVGLSLACLGALRRKA